MKLAGELEATRSAVCRLGRAPFETEVDALNEATEIYRQIEELTAIATEQ